jgi:hypothetical protein
MSQDDRVTTAPDQVPPVPDSTHGHHIDAAIRETLEDYTLRFAPRHYRRWGPGCSWWPATSRSTSTC